VQVDQHGDFVLIGNTLGQECSTANPPVPAPVVGTVGACGANTADTAPDVFWRSEDIPAPGTAEANTDITAQDARSTAVLVLPPDATVTHAYLYWSATVPTANVGGLSATFERPGDFIQSVNAAKTYYSTIGTNPVTPAYQSVADVTALVKQYGPGAYRVGNIDSIDLVDLNNSTVFVGWWMAIFYERASEPARNLALFDGLDLVQSGADTTATLSGFLVPQAGFDAKLGVVAWEGDATIAGDSLYFGGVQLTDDQNPKDNFFNSTRSYLGQPVSNVGDLPQLTGTAGSLSGLDLDVVDVTSILQPNDTQATILATTSQDTFLLGGFITSISTFKPDFTGSTKSVRDISGEAVLPGDVLEYTIVATNQGNDGSVNTVLTDILPAGVTFVPGSLVIAAGANAGPMTDAADNDQAEYDAASRTVTFRLGTGANATNGGALAVNESTTVTLRVTIDANAGDTVKNRASISSSGESGAGSTSASTTSDTGSPGSSTDVIIDTCRDATNCNEDTPICKTDAHPFVCVECQSNADCPAPGAQCEANACTIHAPRDAGSDASPDAGSPDASPPDAGLPDAASETDATDVTGVGVLCDARPGTRSGSVAPWFFGLAGAALIAHRRRRLSR